ncbi:unnamed protein product [Pleuronectes platessa]|uniref:Uncharacterized protein n=1 Tax=Pleuronectes platessa TaxID=8262 RepID=A0A9N7UA45_PLEPL|nr:unnamed protein product [Pleuronectes platessa]
MNESFTNDTSLLLRQLKLPLLQLRGCAGAFAAKLTGGDVNRCRVVHSQLRYFRQQQRAKFNRDRRKTRFFFFFLLFPRACTSTDPDISENLSHRRTAPETQ